MIKITPEQEKQFVNIFQVFALIRTTDLLPQLNDAQLVKVLIWCESRGWLKYRRENNKIVFAACAYNIKEFDEKTCHILPLKSEGDILFVPFMVNIGGKNIMPKEVLTDYLKESPNTKQIVFYKGDSDKPTILTKKGDK